MQTKLLRWLFVPVLAIFAVEIVYYAKFTADDAYIVARFAENFVDSGALVYNRGEPINAMTSPLQAWLEVGLYAATHATIPAYKLVALGAMLAAAGVLVRLFADNVYAGLTSVVILLLSPSMVLWTAGGLETPLAIFFITLLAATVYRGLQTNRWNMVPVYLWAGLAFVTRYDTAVFSAPLVLYATVRARNLRQTLRSALIGAALPVTWLVISKAYYGDWLPTSFYVKQPDSGFYMSRIWQFFFYLNFLLLIPFGLYVLYYLVFYPRLLRGVLRDHFRFTGWIYACFVPVLVYANMALITHMMFSFRLILPFVPAMITLLGDLIRRASVASQELHRESQFAQFFLVGFVLAVGAQLFQADFTYRLSLNGLWRGEYGYEGLQTYADDFMATLEKEATDIRQHWNSLPDKPDRPPRLHTFAAGILPYTYRELYVYEGLVTYRHGCRWAIHLTRNAADYVHILMPLHGPVEAQLPKPVSDYELISSYTLRFDGRQETLMIFYDPAPAPHRLSPDVQGGCG